MQRLFTPIDRSRKIVVIRELDQAGTFSNDYLLLVILSCVIATLGLVLDSAAVIIGAMLIAPLMSPILRCALALVRGDLRRVGHALGTLFLGALLAVVISALLGTLVSSGPFNFLEELPREVLGRTRPNLFDLVVALAGGTAAAYALAQPRLSAALPGVAIATALMPPLCTVGIGLSQGQILVSGGALLLFLANFTAILLASSLTFVLVGFRPARRDQHEAILTPVLVIEGGLVLLVIVALSGLTFQIIGDARDNRTIRQTLMDALADKEDSSLVSFERQEQDDHLTIVATIRAPYTLSYAAANELQHDLAARLQRTVALKLLLIPVTSLDPLVPPTRTPTPEPNATNTPAPTITPSPLPSATPSVTPLPPSATATATPTPTSTPLPTATPRSYAIVAGTVGRGVRLRADPGTGASLGTLAERALVQVLGTRALPDGSTWAEVVLPDGRSGWVAARYLSPYTPFALPGE